MSAYDELVRFVKDHLKPEDLRTFLILVDKLDTEIRRDIVDYARKNNFLK